MGNSKKQVIQNNRIKHYKRDLKSRVLLEKKATQPINVSQYLNKGILMLGLCLCKKTNIGKGK